MFVPVNDFSLDILFLGRLSPQAFVPMDILSLRTFCPSGQFIPPDVLYPDVLSLVVMYPGVLSPDVLSLQTFCLWAFCLRMICLHTICLRTICLRTICLRTFCLRTFCLDTGFQGLGSISCSIPLPARVSIEQNKTGKKQYP
jgi:hypothetical protein